VLQTIKGKNYKLDVQPIDEAISLWTEESSYKNHSSWNGDEAITEKKGRKEKKRKRNTNEDVVTMGGKNCSKKRKIETNKGEEDNAQTQTDNSPTSTLLLNKMDTCINLLNKNITAPNVDISSTLEKERDDLKLQLVEVEIRLEKYKKIRDCDQIITSLKEQIKVQCEKEEQQISILEEDAKLKDKKILELEASNKEKDSTLNKIREALMKRNKENDALIKRVEVLSINK